MIRNAKRITAGLALAGALIWGVAGAASDQTAASAPEDQQPIWMATQMRAIFPH